ncbi:DNRLRE domain-containing protein [Arthrobacter sp. UC242_113]|uniref:DNRLRE domain-containing protein n=1 Tax=Arthrobacter sp. UC242_113 TaxID=3374550 RepID=UPI003756E04E
MSIPIQADVQLREATLLGKTTFHKGGPGRGRLHGSRSLWLHALLTALLLALTALVVPVTAAAADVGVQDFSHTGTGTPTGTKRQTNALWFNDGIWWGNLWDTASSDFHIFRFNASTNSWTNTGVATETQANTHHDVLWDGSTLFVASYRFVNDGLPFEPNFPSTMRRYSYNSSTKTYTLLSSQRIHNNKVETMSIDKDSTGRVWATWQQGNRIFLNVTGTDGITWGTPFAHPASLSNVSVDDNSAVIAFGGAGNGKMGVMWSRQLGDANDGMYWSFHVDGASNTTWSTPVAAVKGLRTGDDHMNLKWLDSTSGQVYAAVKTSNTSASLPLIQLLVLNGTAWSAHTIATVSECPNRVIVMIDESTTIPMLRTFATYPKPSGTTNAGVCTSSGGAVYEKSTPLNNISFTTTKTARIVDDDQYVHNVTSTKQNLNSQASGTVNSGLLVLADVNATSRYWHYYDSTGGGGADTTAPNTTITSPPPGTSASTSFTFTSTEANSTFQCSLDNAARSACTSPRAYTGLSTGSHTFSVWATDAAGNTDATPATQTWTVGSGGGADTTAPDTTITSPPPGTSTSTSFTFTSTEANSTFQCSLDNAARSACTSPRAYTGLSTGSHTFSVWATDAAGNTDATPATQTWSVGAGGGTTPQTVTLTATADSYVTSASPTTNFGTSTLLGVDNSPVEVTYLKFDLTPYAGRTVQSATLQLRSAGSGSTGTQNVRVATGNWDETTITSSGTRPTLGTTPIGTLGPTTTNTNYSITLTPTAVAGGLGQQLSLGLNSSSSDGLDLNSREVSSTAAPKLVLTLG